MARITFNKEARQRYLAFAESHDAKWQGNFRDLAASVTRMATLNTTGRIDVGAVDLEIKRLGSTWHADISEADIFDLILSRDQLAEIDPFDRVQLAFVVKTCRACRSLSEAGRQLFAASRELRTSTNDADRLRKYLARFNLTWTDLQQPVGGYR